ncbi:quorum-sensing system DWW-type pheromone [Streptococcus uberis]|uniref:Membrane protein n=1 Tax=Streptococcus uberis (strain ATCC BAA-854 / 0140J) TaxID=218495 RepID=B9DSU0_STRU0|nr:putative membrane protein [Streptococcus uberis 0140J]
MTFMSCCFFILFVTIDKKIKGETFMFKKIHFYVTTFSFLAVALITFLSEKDWWHIG